MGTIRVNYRFGWSRHREVLIQVPTRQEKAPDVDPGLFS